MKGNKLGAFIKSLIPFLGFLGIQLLVMSGAAIGISIVQTLRQASLGITDVDAIADIVMNKLNDAGILIVLISDVLIAVLFARFYYKRKMGREKKDTWEEAFSLQNLILILCLALGIQLTATMALSILEDIIPDWFAGYNQMIQSTGMGTTVLSFITLVLAAPVAEELVFRGVTLTMARGFLPFAAANVFQAVLFGIVHGNLIQGIYAFGFGLVFGAVYHRYGTIGAAILLHALVNLAGCILSALPGGAWPSAVRFLVLLAAAFLFCGTLAVIMKKNRKRKTEEQDGA